MESKKMTVEARLLELERSARRWRRAACLLVPIIFVGLMMGQGTKHRGGKRVIWAHRFEVQDENAKMVASLSITQDGEPGLVIRDQQGQDRIVLGMVADRPLLRFLDKNGQTISLLEHRLSDITGRPEDVKVVHHVENPTREHH